MTLISLSQVERSFGDRIIFSDVSLRIDETDHIGVVGDNGEGKTTLFRVLTGEDPPDQGTRTARKDLSIAGTAQIPVFAPGQTVLEALQASFADLQALEDELRRLEAAMEANPEDPRLMKRYEACSLAFEAGGGWQREQLANRALQGLGFSEKDRNQDASTLSGGQKVRLELARCLLRPVHLLMLDEPTNHLDLTGIRFLEEHLRNHRGAFVVISHDRTFLDRVANAIVEVEGGKVNRYPGNFSDYRKQKDLGLKTALRDFKKQEDFIAKEMEFIRRHMGSRRTAEAKGRLKRLERLKRIAPPKGDSRSMGLRFGAAKGLEGQTVLEVEQLRFGYDKDKPLFQNLHFRIQHGERVGIVGRNGIGKSSLLSLIAGRLSPDAGKIEKAKKLRISWFRQEMEDLPSLGTVLQALHVLLPDWTEGQCRSHLARFLFFEEDISKSVEVLSGGEKRRLALARLVTQPADILLLDEPTNHLDISSREALEEALESFNGTVVMVSHDRWFLKTLSARILELRPDGVLPHPDFDAFEEALQRDRRSATRKKAAAKSAQELPPPKPGSSSTASGKTGKIRNPWAFQKLEEKIFELEEELEILQKEWDDPELWKDAERMKSLKKKKDSLEETLQEHYERWENWE
ncbi:MAG TPA: ABC-F family ATP-binding cassette domain-containing protein [Planctomycetes bacterium]|nr:ABC-F family ATP-binding cassette domain-containing protein [Planctomycetota bacterium]